MMPKKYKTTYFFIFNHQLFQEGFNGFILAVTVIKERESERWKEGEREAGLDFSTEKQGGGRTARS